MAQYNINFSTNASQAAQQIDRVSQELTKVIKIGQSVKLNLDTSSLSATINTTFRKLNKEIENSQRKLARLQIGGGNFNGMATRLGRAEGLRERGQLAAAPYRLRAQAEAFGPGSAISRSKVLEALQIQASQIAPNTVEWVKFQQQIAQVNLEIKKTDKLAESIQLRENLGAFAPGSLAQLETRLTLIKNKAREITPNTTGWKQLNKEIQQLEGGIARANKKPLTAGQRAGAAGGAFLYGGGLGGGVGSAVGGIAGGLAGGVPGAFAGAAVGQAVDNLITYSAAIATTTAEVNKSKIALAGVTKNVNDYDFALKTARDAGDKFLIPITEAARKFTKLQASVVGAGFDTKTTAKTFNAISAAIIATGGSTEDLNGALTATAQVFSKGKVTAEELRGQIGERLPGAFTIFAQSIGKTPQQLDKALQDGEVSLGDFIKFVEELGKRYSTTAEELANAPENAGARLKVSLEAASASYGTFFQIAGAGFQNYATALVNFAIDNESTIKKVLASFVVLAEDLVSILSKVVKTLAPVFGSFFGYIFENFAKGINAIATLAEESQRAAGAPEERAAKQVEKLYPNPVQRFIAGANPFSQIRKDYEDALRVEKDYDKKSSQVQDSRESRLKKYIEEFKPTKFGASLGESLSKPGGDGGQSTKQNLESFERLRDQLANAYNQAEIERIKARYELQKRLQEDFYDMQEFGANRLQKQNLQFLRALAQAEQKRQDTVLEAQLRVTGASGKVAPSAPMLPSANGMGTSGLTSFTSQQLTRATQDASRFTGVANMCSESVKAFYKSLGVSLPGVTAWADTVRNAGQTMTDWSKLQAGDIVATGKPGDTPHVGVYTGGQNVFHQSRKRGLKAGNYPDLSYFQQEGYFVRPTINAGAPGKVGSNASRDTMAAATTDIAQQSAVFEERSSLLVKQSAILKELGRYTQEVYNVPDLTLDNQLLKARNDLLEQGLDENTINYKMRVLELDIQYQDLLKAFPAFAAAANLNEDERIGILAILAQALQKAKDAEKGKNDETLRGIEIEKTRERDKYIKSLQEEIKLLGIIDETERRREELRQKYGNDEAKIQEILDLEKIKKNIEDTRALIGDFVSSTSSDYKGFLKAVISGEDAADALQQFQEGLKDRVLTIFLDFAMAPVEKFLKESLEGLFLPKAETIPGTDISKAITKDPVEATNGNTNATVENTVALREATAAFSGAAGGGQSTSALNAAMQNIGGVAFDTNVGAGQGFDAANIFGNPEALKETFASLQGSLSESMLGISSSFESATSSIAGTLPAWNDAFATQLPDSLKKATDGTNKETPKFQESLGKVAQGIGIAAGAIIGIAAGISQIKKGGAGNVLMGIGSILGSVGGAIGGFASLGKAANGAVWKGGFQAFANGGMVTSPTLGLVGEGKYNEAIVPLPDGRSIPVQMQGESIRDKMGGRSMGGAAASPVLSMSFQSTTINGVEYVDRAQLEAAMNETRRMATREGATRGANLALDKLANSPSSRRRVGLR